MANTEVARAEVILNGQKANATLKELENSAKALNAELRKLPTNSAEFTKKTEEFQKVKGRLNEVKQEIIGTQGAMSKFADWTNKYFQSITLVAAAFTGLGMAIGAMVKNAGDLEDSLANMRKTTGMTADEVKNLNSEFKKIDTRTSREELRNIAIVAGQLGIEKESIFSFTDSIDKLNVALGDELAGGAEGVASTMGTLRNVLTDLKTTNVSDDLLRLGNAINDLSASGLATAPVLADFANRIGGVGINLGLSSDEVLGMSATMQELAINTERGGTAIVKILSKMTTNTGEFAKVAGLPLEEFTRMVDTDLYGAFVKVLEGSKNGGEGATILGRMIKELEISGIGAAEVFSKLGNNTDMLSQKITMAGGSLQNTDGILNEFNIKNTTLGATLNKLGKDFNSLMSSAALMSVLKAGVMVVVDLVAWLKALPQTIKNNAIALTVLSGAVLVWIASATRGIQTTILNNILMKEGILLRIKDAVVLEALVLKERLYNLAKSEGSVATKLATLAQWAWNAAMSANPIGLIIAAITALVAGIAAYNKYSTAAIANEKEKASLTVLLVNANVKLDETYNKIVAQLKNLNKLSSEEKDLLKESIDLKIKAAEAELLLFEAKQKSVGKAAAKPTTWQSIKTSFQTPADAAVSDHVYATENSKEAMSEYNDGIDALKTKIFQLKESRTSLTDVIYAEYNANKINLKTQEALTEKLSLYQTALRNTVAGSDDFVRINTKIKTVQKELAAFDRSDTSTDDKTKGATKLKTAYEKLSDEIKSYIELLQKQVSTSPELAQETAAKIAQLQKEKEALDELVKLEIERAKYDHSVNISKVSPIGPQGADLGKKGVDATGKMKKIEDVQSSQPGSMGEEEADPILTAAIKDAEEVVGYVSMVKDTLGNLDSWLASRENMELAKDEQANKKKEINLKNRLDAGLITQKQYNDATAKNDATLAAKKRKIDHDQAVRAKAMAVVQAGINVALGITSALSNIPVGFALAIVTGILGAVQIAAILAAPVPQAAKGRYNVTGRDDGKLYSNVPYSGPARTGLYSTPTLISEEGPEYIIDAKTTRNLQMNYPGIIDAIHYARVPQFASGNYPNKAPSGSSQNNNSSAESLLLLSAINELNTHAKNGFRSFVVYDDMRTAADTINEIETNVKSS